MRKLKTKIWREAIIKIDRIVEQYKEGYIVRNKTIGYDIEIKSGVSTYLKRVKTGKKLLEFLKERLYLKCKK